MLGLLAAAAGSRAHATTPTRLDLLPTGDVGVMLAARVTLGSETAVFVLDTGATTHLIDPRLGSRLALPTESSADVSLPGGRTRVRQVTLPEFHLGAEPSPPFAAQRALEIDLAALRNATGEDVRGPLGMPLWRSTRPPSTWHARNCASTTPHLPPAPRPSRCRCRRTAGCPPWPLRSAVAWPAASSSIPATPAPWSCSPTLRKRWRRTCRCPK